jgi:membrane protein
VFLMKGLIRELWSVTKDAGAAFLKQHVLRLSASLCFYTIFSLGPMLLVIIYISGLFWQSNAAEGTIYSQIRSVIGEQPARQIQELIKNATITKTDFMAIISVAALLFAATTAFNEMHKAINIIWNLKVKKGRGLMQMLKSRLIAFLLISGIGLLLFIFLLGSSLFEGFMHKIREIFPQFSVELFYVLDILFLFVTVTLLFGMIYKILPDAYIKWKDVIAGAIFVSILFTIGKFGFSFFINRSNFGSSYGSAGSFVVLLVWIYYSAAMLYFGAEFTKAYAIKFGDEIIPKDYAVTIKVIQVESNEKSVQQNERSAESAEKQAIKEETEKSEQK